MGDAAVQRCGEAVLLLRIPTNPLTDGEWLHATCAEIDRADEAIQTTRKQHRAVFLGVERRARWRWNHTAAVEPDDPAIGGEEVQQRHQRAHLRRPKLGFRNGDVELDFARPAVGAHASWRSE